MENDYKRGSLENDAKGILVPRHTLVLDDTWVRETLDEVDLPHQLRDFILSQPSQTDPLDRDHLARVQI